MILSDKDLKILLNNKELVIEPFPNEIKICRIILHLDNILKIDIGEFNDVNNDQKFREMNISDGYLLKPNEHVIAFVKEKIKMPNGYIGWIETKGKFAKMGLQTNNNDSHIDPGYEGKINLQLKNNSNK